MTVAVVLSLPALPVPAAADLPGTLQGVGRIVALGDSITEAGGEAGGYVWLLERYLSALDPTRRIEVVNAGVGGHKSTDMAARFTRDVLDRKPDLVTISVGINDVWHAFRDFQAGRNHPAGNLPAGVPLPVYRTKLQTMIEAARAAGIRVVLVSPTVIYEDLDGPENARLLTYVRAIRNLARRYGVTFVDVNTPFRQVIRAYQQRGGRGANLLTTDGVHLNAAGNRLLAATLLRGLGVSDADLSRTRIAP